MKKSRVSKRRRFCSFLLAVLLTATLLPGQAISAAAEALHRLGMQVREVSIPSLPYALPAYYVISSAEASSASRRAPGT